MRLPRARCSIGDARFDCCHFSSKLSFSADNEQIHQHTLYTGNLAPAQKTSALPHTAKGRFAGHCRGPQSRPRLTATHPTDFRLSSAVQLQLACVDRLSMDATRFFRPSVQHHTHFEFCFGCKVMSLMNSRFTIQSSLHSGKEDATQSDARCCVASQIVLICKPPRRKIETTGTQRGIARYVFSA